MKKTKRQRNQQIKIKKIESVNKKLQTWKKHNVEFTKKGKDIYRDIETLAMGNNIKFTKSGNISKTTKKEDIENFERQLKDKYGTYSSYKRIRKEQYKRYQLNDPNEVFSSWIDYVVKTDAVNAALSNMWKNGPGDTNTKRLVMEKALDMPTNDALDYIDTYVKSEPLSVDEYNSSSNNPSADVLDDLI